jgi:hypothetical protein
MLIPTATFAENFVEYKTVRLCANHQAVLVNRITGEVQYKRIGRDDRWRLLEGVEKIQYQNMYNAQVQLKYKCQ